MDAPARHADPRESDGANGAADAMVPHMYILVIEDDL